jgi:hypothetical protein
MSKWGWDINLLFQNTESLKGSLVPPMEKTKSNNQPYNKQGNTLYALGLVRLGSARPTSVQLPLAWQGCGWAWLLSAWIGAARLGSVRSGSASWPRLALAWLDSGLLVLARSGSAWPGRARLSQGRLWSVLVRLFRLVFVWPGTSRYLKTKKKLSPSSVPPRKKTASKQSPAK